MGRALAAGGLVFGIDEADGDAAILDIGNALRSLNYDENGNWTAGPVRGLPNP